MTGGITNSGTISAGANGAGIDVGATTFSGGVTNAGTISAADVGIYAHNVTNISGGIVNTSTATITSGSIGSSGSEAIRLDGPMTFLGGINNAGAISTSSSGIYLTNVTAFSDAITNSGTITTGGNGILVTSTQTFSDGITNSSTGIITSQSSGIAISSVPHFSGGIRNAGTITSTGSFSNAIHITSGAGSTFFNGIINSGAITAATNGTGIFLDFPTFSGGITNNASGTITGANGIQIGSTTSLAGGISNDGTITAGTDGINIAAGATISGNITNAGTITGSSNALNLGNTAGAFTVINTGTLNGNILLGINTLQLGNGGTTGSITGNVASNGIFAINRLNNYSFGGVVSGNGALQQLGTGTTTLTNTNTYSGGTTINAGTLVLSGSGTLGHTANTLTVSGGTLDLGTTPQTQNGGLTLSGGTILNGTLSSTGTFSLQAGTVSAVLAGTGAISKITTGTVTLSGINAYTGATNVNAGTLSVTGDISSSSSVTVNGGTLGGTGTVPATTISNGGTLIPGAGGIPGTLNVSGAVTFNNGSTYSVLFSPTAISKTIATGAATLTGGTVVVTPQTGTSLAGSYKILTASSFIGTFAGLALNSTITGVKNPHLTYDATNVFLTLDQGTLGPILPTIKSANVSNVSSGIDNAINNTATLPSAFQKLFGLSGSALTNALTQISGEPGAGGGRQAGTHMMGSFLTLALNPFGGSPGGNPGNAGVGRGFAAERELLPEVAAAYAAVTPHDLPKIGVPAGAGLDRRWGVWGQAYGGYSKRAGDTNVGTHDTAANSYCFATGLDYRVTRDTMVGFALAGGGSNYGVADGLGGGRSDVFQMGVYGSKQFGAAYVSAALSYAAHWMTTDRTVTVAGSDHLRANFIAESIGGRLESGYRFDTKPVGATPYVALQVQNFWTPSYTETAVSGSNAFLLSYNAQSTTAIRTELGIWLDKMIALDRGNELSRNVGDDE
ncbi:MAG: autotransporter domain-containing protein [Planctomycetota bacterium]